MQHRACLALAELELQVRGEQRAPFLGKAHEREVPANATVEPGVRRVQLLTEPVKHEHSTVTDVDLELRPHAGRSSHGAILTEFGLELKRIPLRS